MIVRSCVVGYVVHAHHSMPDVFLARQCVYCTRVTAPYILGVIIISILITIFHQIFIFYSKVVRKSVARVKTVMSHNQRENLKKFYAKKKYKPLDLRPKLTRAKRRELTKFEKTRKTLREKKWERHFPKRIYAVKM